MTAEHERDQKAQAEADRLFAGDTGPRWRVCLGGHPHITVPAADRAEAVRRYYQVCGITFVDPVSGPNPQVQPVE